MPVQTLHDRIVVPSTDKLSEVQEVWCGPPNTRLLAFLCGCVWNCRETRVPCMPFPFFNVLLTRCCRCDLILWSACWEEHTQAWLGQWRTGDWGAALLQPLSQIVSATCADAVWTSLIVDQGWRCKGGHTPHLLNIHRPTVIPSSTEVRAGWKRTSCPSKCLENANLVPGHCRQIFQKTELKHKQGQERTFP